MKKSEAYLLLFGSFWFLFGLSFSFGFLISFILCLVHCSLQKRKIYSDVWIYLEHENSIWTCILHYRKLTNEKKRKKKKTQTQNSKWDENVERPLRQTFSVADNIEFQVYRAVSYSHLNVGTLFSFNFLFILIFVALFFYSRRLHCFVKRNFAYATLTDSITAF